MALHEATVERGTRCNAEGCYKIWCARQEVRSEKEKEDVAEDLEPRMLSQGRTMLIDSAEKPATAPSNSSTAASSAGKPDEDDINSSMAGAEMPATLQEVQAWLATCTEETFTDTPPLKRLKTAVDVCTLPPSVTRRTRVQQFWPARVERNAETPRRETECGGVVRSAGGRSGDRRALVASRQYC